MALIDVDTLLAQVGESEPCGPDLEYDSAFLALDEASRGKPEQQFGDTIIPAEEPDWRKVQSLSSELMTRTKDVRVAVHLLRSSTRLQGLAAAADGLRLLHGLLTQYWDHVHPMLDADDDNDPTMRLNALAPLVDGAGFLADVRKSGLGVGRSSITGRDFELAAGKAQPYEGESVTPLAGVIAALQEAEGQQAGLLAALALARGLVWGRSVWTVCLLVLVGLGLALLALGWGYYTPFAAKVANVLLRVTAPVFSVFQRVPLIGQLSVVRAPQ